MHLKLLTDLPLQAKAKEHVKLLLKLLPQLKTKPRLLKVLKNNY
jgi:hypothetical protein